MATTISSLRRALNEPQSHFSMLSSIQKVEGNIIRSTHFAEVQIEWQDEAWLLLMPLTPHAMRRIERLEPKKLHLSSDIMPEIRILKDEMFYECCAEQLRCDIVLEKLPKAPAVIYDIGGAYGEYAWWLTSLGYEVHLFDLSETNILMK